MEAIKKGDYDLQAEETCLNAIRKGLAAKNNVTDQITKLGLASFDRAEEIKEENLCVDCNIKFDTSLSLEVHLQYHNKNLYSKWASSLMLRIKLQLKWKSSKKRATLIVFGKETLRLVKKLLLKRLRRQLAKKKKTINNQFGFTIYDT